MTATRQPKTEVQAKPVSYLSTRHVFKTLRLLIACENPEACRTIASILNKMRFSKVLMRGKSDTIHFAERISQILENRFPGRELQSVGP